MGGTGGQGGDGGAGCDALGCTPCRDCAADGPCTIESAACQQAPGCTDLHDCMEYCGQNNPPCASDCEGQYPDAVSAFDSLDGCLTSTCVMSCGAGGG